MSVIIDGSAGVTTNSGAVYNGIQSGTAQTMTVAGLPSASPAGAYAEFTGIPSWVKRITVMFSGVSTSGTSGKLVQIGDSGGIENTGYLGGSQLVQQATGFSGLYSTAGIPINSASASDTLSGSIVFTLLQGNTWTAAGAIYNSSSQTGYCAGSKELSGTLDRIRITTVNGTDTFDGGTVNIMYE